MPTNARPLSALILGIGGSGAWTVVRVKHQLLDMYNNQIPDNVALAVLDTADEPIVSVGAEGMERRLGTGVGKVRLEPYEYVHVGGDAYDMVQAVAETDQYSYIKSWLLARRYLSDLPRNMFQLDKGAGMFRQLGRLALFRSVAQPANSPVAAVLDTKLTGIANESNQTILVMIVGSLAGGTGAGLFLDVPHIIRRVAAHAHIQVTLRGFFYLPQAFQRDLDASKMEPAKARAFAAMRELSRFMLSEDYQYGYPMYYHGERSGVNKAIWRAKSREKLYDFVYVLDGEGEVRMNNRVLADGTASVVADAIVSFVDPSFSKLNEQMLANMPSAIATRQGRVGKQAMISTLGSFSMILPVQQMIEAWAYKLGKEIVHQIVPGSSYDGEYLLKLSNQHNPEHRNEDPAVEVNHLLTSHTPIPDPYNENRSIVPTTLWEQVQKFYDKYQLSRSNAVRELSAYDLRTWLNVLVPPSLGADTATQHAIVETKQVIGASIYDHAETSDKRPQGDPAVDWRDIATKSERYITTQLGPVDPGGGRQGGRYGDALQRFIDLQLGRFREYIGAYLMHTLNGTLSSSRDSIDAKTGRLGWSLAVIDQMYAVFTTVSDLMEEVRAGTDTFVSNMRANIQNGMQQAFETMREKSTERRRIGFGTPPAIVAQESYLARIEEYVEFYRTEFARLAVAMAIRRIHEFLDNVRSELETWAAVLGTHNNSLYNELLIGTRRVETERAQAGSLANHEVINDIRWENSRYDRYVNSSNQKERMLLAWNWSIGMDGDRLAVGVHFGENGQTAELRKDMRGKWSDSNLQIVLGYMRAVFAEAIGRESILEYLMEKYRDTEDELAVELARRSGHLLSMGQNPMVEGRTTANIVLASHDSKNPGEVAFLERLLRRLGAEKNLGDIEGQDFPTLRLTQCANPFRLTLLSTAELIEMRGITAYNECQQRYLDLPFDTRQTTHIFPAEVHAVVYEKNLVKLNQPSRMLSDRVVLLLENEDRFREFLFLLAHGIIVRKERSEHAQTRFGWFLRMPDPGSRRGEIFDWWLTELSSAPSLLEAMVTYIILEEDRRGTLPNPEIRKPIHHPGVLRYLRQARRDDTQQRVERDQLAILEVRDGEVIFDEELRRWTEAFMPPLDTETGEEIRNGWNAEAFLGPESEDDESDQHRLGVAELVVRHDIACELRKEFADNLLDLQRRVRQAEQHLTDGVAHDELRSRQEDYDLYTVAILVLDQEIEQLRQVVKDRYIEKTGQNRRL